MKWIQVLLFSVLLASCTTQKKGEVSTSGDEVQTVDESSQIATESEAKPVSPLTVKPCFCMKIFQPVCANGVNYGNSCEAECHGNKTWKDGNCPAPKK